MIKWSITIFIALLASFVFAFAATGDDPPPPTAYITGASHIDLEWKWRFSEAVDVSYRTFSAVLDIMDDYDDYPGGNPVYYSQSQALLYEQMELYYPETFQRIKDRVADGQWELVGGMWVEPDANLPGGESFIRQLYYGKRYFMDRFGVDVDVGWLPDSFGYNGNLPQFFSGAGVDKFYYFKTNWNDTHKPTLHDFWWIGPDGSAILAHLSWEHYNNQVFKWTMTGAYENVRNGDPNAAGFLYPIGMGDHGGGIGRWNIDGATRIKGEQYPMHFGPAGDYFDSVLEKGVDTTVTGELYFESHRGSYTSRALHKKQVRGLEYGLLGAEASGALASLGGWAYPSGEYESAWKALMLDQFHDTMAGTCLEVVYAKDVAERNAAAFNAIELNTTAAINKLAGTSHTSPDYDGEGWFVVFNPLGFEITTPVLIPVPGGKADELAVYSADDQKLKCQPDVDGGGLRFIAEALPAFGWRAYKVSEGQCETETPYAAGDYSLRNSYLSLRLSKKTGLVESLQSGAVGNRELIQPGAGGNLLQVYHDAPVPFDSWDIGFDKYTEYPIEEVDYPDHVELVESGPVRSVIRIKRHSFFESYEQDVILYYDLPRVDFTTRVYGWGKKSHRMLKVAFPLNLVNENKTVTTQMPYGSITRVLDGSVANWEFAGHKWADISENSGGEKPGPGIALLARDTYGYDVANDGPGTGLSDGAANILRASLLKSGTSPLYLIPQRGGPITDRGDFEFQYALYPHTGSAYDANMLKKGNEYYAPVVLRFTGDQQPRELPAFIDVEPDNALASWLKAPETPPFADRVLLRIVESRGKNSVAKVKVNGYQVAQAGFVDFLEQETGGLVTILDDNTLEFELGANKIVTLDLRLAFGDPDDDDDDDDADGGDLVQSDDGEDIGGCGC